MDAHTHGHATPAGGAAPRRGHGARPGAGLTAVGTVFVLALVRAGDGAQPRVHAEEAAQQAVRRAVRPAARRQRSRGRADQLPADPRKDGVGRPGAQGARGPRRAWSGRNSGFSPTSRTMLAPGPWRRRHLPGSLAGCALSTCSLPDATANTQTPGPVSLGDVPLSRTVHCRADRVPSARPVPHARRRPLRPAPLPRDLAPHASTH